MTEKIFYCFNCANDLSFLTSSTIGRAECCEKCLADVHCCKNCKEFDPSLYNSCRESEAERVLDKEKANFCDWFKPGKGNGAEKSSDKKSEDKFAELDKLFK